MDWPAPSAAAALGIRAAPTPMTSTPKMVLGWVQRTQMPSAASLADVSGLGLNGGRPPRPTGRGARLLHWRFRVKAVAHPPPRRPPRSAPAPAEKQASCSGVDHRRPSDRSAGLCRTLRPARSETVRREAGRQPLQFDPSRRRHYVLCVCGPRALMLATHALPRPTTGRLSGPRGPAFMEAAWKRQKEGDRSSASAPDPRIPCMQPESAAGGSRRK